MASTRDAGVGGAPTREAIEGPRERPASEPRLVALEYALLQATMCWSALAILLGRDHNFVVTRATRGSA